MDGGLPEMEVEELARRLAVGDPPFVLDVREPWEIEICALPGATAIPLGDLAQRLGELPDDREIVVVCHHGGRSARAVGFLRSRANLEAVNLRGGVDAWAERIDRAMARYD